MVYFIRAVIGNDTFYKIGFTKGSAKQRLKQLQTSNPVKLELIKEFPGDLWEEKKIHKYLSSLRTEGEWFRHGPIIEHFLRIPPGNSLFNNSEWVYEGGKCLKKWKVRPSEGKLRANFKPEKPGS